MTNATNEPILEEVQLELGRKHLKVEALKQRLAEITVQYEDKDADRRVEITELSMEIQRLREFEKSVNENSEKNKPAK